MAPPAPDRLALRADAAYDGLHDHLVEDPVIVVESGIITAFGRAAEVTVSPTVPAAHLPGLTLLPGLMDVHVHLDGERSYHLGERLTVSRGLAMLRAADDCQRLLVAGFTTVRDCGSAAGIDLRNAINEGSLTGPRIYAAGPIICQTGGHADSHSRPLSEVSEDPAVLLADGADSCRRAVRTAIRKGADFIKICTSGGIGSENDSPHDQQFTAEEIRAIVDEAHRAGRQVASHAQGRTGILAAVRAGIDSIEHGYYLDDECASEMAQRETWLVPTSALIDVFRSHLENPAGVPQGRLRKEAEAVRAMPTGLRCAIDAGVRIAAGSDYLGLADRAHGNNADEIISLVKYGMSPHGALQSATRRAAELLGISREVGCLQAGQRADIVGLPGDPLADITLLRRISFVMKDGHVHRSPPELRDHASRTPDAPRTLVRRGAIGGPRPAPVAEGDIYTV